VKFLAALSLLWTGSLAAAPAERMIPLDEAVYANLLASHKGKVLLVNFWATWCEPCRAEMPALVRLAQQLGPKGFQLVTVSADELEDEKAALEFLRKARVPGPFYLKSVKSDDRFITSVDAKWSGALPASFLFDRSGRKMRSFVGEVEISAVEAAIRKIL